MQNKTAHISLQYWCSFAQVDNNGAYYPLLVTVLHLFVVAKWNNRLQSQGFEEHNDSSWLSNSDNTAWLLQKLWPLFCRANPFSPCYPLLRFLLSAFFILCIIGHGSVLRRILPSSEHICFPSSRVPLLLDVRIFIIKSLSYSLPFLLWHNKTATVFDKCGWLQRCRFVVINTYCIYKRTRKYGLVLHRV